MYARVQRDGMMMDRPTQAGHTGVASGADEWFRSISMLLAFAVRRPALPGGAMS